jgi:hypothetical protein
VIPLERPNAEHVFDGYIGDKGLVRLNLRGEFTWTGENALPTGYKFPIQSPEVWIPNESYLTLLPPSEQKNGFAIDYNFKSLIPGSDWQGF